jgi:AraC-like DNA-binding protein
MKRFLVGADRGQSTLLPECLDDWTNESNPVRAVDAFVDALDLARLGFEGIAPKATGRPSYHPSALLKLYIYGYLNRVQSSRRLEREAERSRGGNRWHRSTDTAFARATLTGDEADHVKSRRNGALDYIEANLGNAQLGPDEIADAAHVSRASLYRLLAAESVSTICRDLSSARRLLISEQIMLTFSFRQFAF